MIKRSKQHLIDNNKTYFQHMRGAFRYGSTCIIAGIMAIVHGLVPAWFETNASDRVKRLINTNHTRKDS